ncbi:MULTISPECIES: hypothetical protein [unclassified Crossiella]|uniref:hypothetical protein n=1 Tax=unclassified Crossiella TaxID=2620835 RepID=UPI0020000117|nr:MULTISPECIES: hypothetical protein [unclassified Crossiella]MCK2242187.1 hypothetical protein [Crossiella sp. S99.2]MCK2256090.1 hypothetical protein [Crossiella sp. S99.1]
MTTATMLPRLRAITAHIDRHELHQAGSVSITIHPDNDDIVIGTHHGDDRLRMAAAWYESFTGAMIFGQSRTVGHTCLHLRTLLEGWDTWMVLNLDGAAATVATARFELDARDEHGWLENQPVDVAVLRTWAAEGLPAVVA